MSKFPRIIFLILHNWLPKTLLAFITLVVVFLITTNHLELIFSSRFLYSFFYSLVLFSILIMTCTSLIVFNFFMNLQHLIPYLQQYGNFPPRKKIIRETKLPSWQVFILLKTHQDVIKAISYFKS